MMTNDKTKSVLDRITNLVGRDNRIGKALEGYQKLREANQISQHFSTYLTSLCANNDALRHEVYRIRHEVYCEELQFEPVKDNGEEKDEFDTYSLHCLIRHISSGQHAGTVRLVTPQTEGQFLPIEKYCLTSITDTARSPVQFARKDVCEVSRLAVPKAFRRRQMDNYAGAALGLINQDTYSETELRCFPFIAVGLYFSAAALALQNGIKHAYVMIEPRLARSMGFVGIKFHQIGPVVDYHGKRAPYYINQELLYKNLTPGFKIMLEHIQRSLKEQPSSL